MFENYEGLGPKVDNIYIGQNGLLQKVSNPIPNSMSESKWVL